MEVTVTCAPVAVDVWRDELTSAAICAGRNTRLVSLDNVKVLESLWQSVVFTPHTNVLLLPPLVQGVIAISLLLSSAQSYQLTIL